MFQNTKWIILCKVIQSLLQMILGMITARYLGPSDYGLISYAASLTAFAVPFMRLGLDETLVREYVTDPDREGEIAGTAMVMNLVSAFACMMCVMLFSAAANRTEPVTIAVCVLYSVCLIFQALEMMQYWFHARLLSKYSSLAMLLSYALVAVYKIVILVTRRSIYWFAVIHSVEYGITALILVTAYVKLKGRRLSCSLRTAGMLFSRSKYYILASLMVTVFQNTDHIMLKMMIGDVANGYYTSAITCTATVGFVYAAIIDSWRPVILDSFQSEKERFDKNIICLYSVVIYLALIQSVFFAVLAKYIILFLYGAEYSPAVPVLQILVWMQAFSYMGTVRNIWILAMEKHRFLWIINLCGVIFNIAANAAVIPVWGACGAAAASVATQIVTNFILGFLIRPIRENNRLLIRAVNPVHLLDAVRIWKA